MLHGSSGRRRRKQNATLKRLGRLSVMAANKERAQTHLAELSEALSKLTLVIPGVKCDLLQEQLKAIHQAISVLGVEIENHG
jgi:hypothetical protein